MTYQLVQGVAHQQELSWTLSYLVASISLEIQVPVNTKSASNHFVNKKADETINFKTPFLSFRTCDEFEISRNFPNPPPPKTLKNIDNIRKAMDLPFAPPSAPTRFVSIRWPMVPTPRPVRYPPVSAKSSKTEKAATMFCPKKFLHSKMETWKHRNAFKTLPLIWGCFFHLYIGKIQHNGRVSNELAEIPKAKGIWKRHQSCWGIQPADFSVHENPNIWES